MTRIARLLRRASYELALAASWYRTLPHRPNGARP